jgi:Mg-chelatase subunit ChlD
MSSTNISTSFFCPITHNIMSNPYIDNEGNSYEYDAICKWLEMNTTSPITRNTLLRSHLKPNRALLDIINSSNLIVNNNSDNISIENNFSPEDVTINLNLSKYSNDIDTYFKLDINPIQGKKTAPLDIVTVIDISGSMSSPAYVMQNGMNTDVGFTILDITKHSLKMILNSLTPIDRISIITFSSDAKVLCNLTNVIPSNNNYLVNLINNLKVEGATNIWAGINEGLKQFETSNNTLNNRISAIMFLTDGIPSSHLLPPKGIINTLERKIANYNEKNIIIPNIYTYGFGYSLDTELLVDIAKIGNGNFSFIPDSGFVGTVLINSLAYIKTKINSDICLDFKNTCNNFLTNAKSYNMSLVNNKKYIKSIHYGHNLSYIFKITNENLKLCNDILSFTITYKTLNNNKKQIVSSFKYLECENISNEDFDIEISREDLIETLDTNNYNLLVNYINDYEKKYKNNNNNIVKDFKEQIIQSIQNTNYQRWGKNYINSFREAHRDKRCNNFKDSSIQSYGGELFNKIVEELNDIYDNLPAPIPSNTVYNDIGNNRTISTTWGATRGVSSPINFSQSFNCQDNGCFHGDTNIIMSDYSIKKIKDIKKGDKLLDKDNKVSTVVCLIKMKCTNNKCFLTEIKGIKNNLLITPFHPVIDVTYPSTIGKNTNNYNWVFPYTISMNSTFVDCDYIYNLVLDINHNIIAENTVCVTLGHNFNSNFVISHDYFGSHKVIDDLSKLNGYENGLIYLEGNYIERDVNTGRVIKYKQ